MRNLKINLFFSIVAIIFLEACSPKIITPSIIEKTIVKDSIVEIIRDSIVIQPADSSWLKALLVCDSLGNIHFQELLDYRSGKNITPPKVIIKDNVITAISSMDSVNIFLKMKDRYHFSRQENIKIEKEIVEVNKLTKLQSFWIVLGRIFGFIMLLILGIGGFKLFRVIKL